jgi:hypothetical protein
MVGNLIMDDKDNKIVFQYYLVAYLDLVGQRDSLRKMLSIPTTSIEKEDFIKTAKNSLGKVLQIRKGFTDFLNVAKRPLLDLSFLPKESRAVMQKAREVECNMSSFSDSIIITVPLSGDDEKCKAMNGVELALLSICGLAALAFADKIILRGGVDVGIGAKIDGNEIYGSALTRAYYLESEIAEYPRFVVGTELWEFLKEVSIQNPQTKLGEIAKKAAVDCKRMIIQDTDGWFMLDFLGEEVKKSLGESLPDKLFSLGYDFILSEYEKFQKTGNDKLAPRYYRLLQYYLERKKIWDYAKQNNQ